MVVNSFSFLFFFIVVFCIYYLPIEKKRCSFQNIWILIVSYLFYGFADLRMIPLLLGTTIIFWGVGRWLKSAMISEYVKKASIITTFGVSLGVSILLYFKYFNFFAESIASFLTIVGLKVSWPVSKILIPIGVSFFIFKLISYIIEIHREHIEPCNNFIDFATYVAFFPTIMSGPIDRPNSFLPQLGGGKIF